MLSFTADAAQNVQSMRLRDDPPAITQPARPSKKRKTPPTANDQSQLHGLPPPHALMHPMPGPLPPGYSYAPSDYTPGGMPQGVLQQPQQGQLPDPSQGATSRTLSNSKRAEQNRKAQRAFRERRDQSVCILCPVPPPPFIPSSPPDMSRPSSPDPTSSMPLFSPQMRQIVGGKNVEPSSTSSVSKTLLYEQPSPMHICCPQISPLPPLQISQLPPLPPQPQSRRITGPPIPQSTLPRILPKSSRTS
jgi:hypothetical protein